MKFKTETLMFGDQVVTKEFSFATIDISKEEFDLDLFVGLKKVFDIKDKDNQDLEKVIKYATADQLRMLMFVDEIMDRDIPDNNLVAIFTNYMFDENGEENPIQEIATIHKISESIFVIGRLENYTLTEFAKNFDLTQLKLD